MARDSVCQGNCFDPLLSLLPVGDTKYVVVSEATTFAMQIIIKEDRISTMSAVELHPEIRDCSSSGTNACMHARHSLYRKTQKTRVAINMNIDGIQPLVLLAKHSLKCIHLKPSQKNSTKPLLYTCTHTHTLLPMTCL